MEVLIWGIPIIVWIQNLGDFLLEPMQFFTFLGTEYFYLLVLPALLWCFDAGLGLRVGFILLTSISLNTSLKIAFGMPRPYWVSTKIQALSSETSYGLPSGHAQNALSLWGRVAAGIKRGWAYLFAGGLILLVSISRLYLGVHFPADLLAGWILGGLLLAVFLIADRPIKEWLARQDLSAQILISFLYSMGLLGFGLLIVALTSDRSVPEVWLKTAQQAIDHLKPIEPRSLRGLISSTGVVFGLGAGGALLARWGVFKAGGAWRKRIARYIVGLIGVMVLYFGLKILFPSDDSIFALSLRYLRYALVGFWVSYLAPRAFSRLQLV